MLYVLLYQTVHRAAKFPGIATWTRRNPFVHVSSTYYWTHRHINIWTSRPPPPSIPCHWLPNLNIVRNRWPIPVYIMIVPMCVWYYYLFLKKYYVVIGTYITFVLKLFSLAIDGRIEYCIVQFISYKFVPKLLSRRAQFMYTYIHMSIIEQGRYNMVVLCDLGQLISYMPNNNRFNHRLHV